MGEAWRGDGVKYRTSKNSCIDLVDLTVERGRRKQEGSGRRVRTQRVGRPCRSDEAGTPEVGGRPRADSAGGAALSI
jgi:hypothetical protein